MALVSEGGGTNTVLVWCSSSSPLVSDLCGPELTGKDNVEIACHGL